jgi:3-oxoacyl-[acyl-carrier protein] reductase
MSVSDPFSLAGRVALVTGSSRGLGRAMAVALGRAGARVALNYLNSRETADRAFADFKSQKLEGMLVQADVTDQDSVNRMTQQVAEQLGPIDIVVINATCDQPHKPIEEYDWDFFQSMVDFFIKSPYLLCRACLPHMKKQRWGRVINIGSEVVERGVPNFTAYVAAKGGQNGFHRSLAREVARWGITVNMICPGWIPVERHVNDPQSEKDGYRALIPADRWGLPEDLAGAVTFLASDASSFITGQSLHVNGGMTVS